jgi:GMP synthase (glutamine-hydrolysing)
MGGPMNVDEIDKYPFLFSEVQLIEKVLSENKPTLGICLGSQLIAKALGSKIYPNKFREVGWHPIQPTEAGKNDRLFSLLTAAPSVFHWHGDTFDLPKGAVHLARSQKCENQAFKWGAATYALQFHLEVTPVMVNDWCSSLESESYIHSAGESKEDIVHRTPAE